jgi:hypothetical protein
MSFVDTPLRRQFLWAMPRLFGREGFFYETLVMSRRAPAVYAGVRSDSRLETFVAQQLSDDFKAARFGIKQHLRAQMTKLMRREHDAGSPV